MLRLAQSPLSKPLVADILASRPGAVVHTIAPAAPVHDALVMMADRQVGALVVVEGERVVGIVTERDYARKIVLKARKSRKTPVRDIMTSDVIQVRSSQSVEECMVLMARNHLRHLPVIDDGKLVGMISIRDLVDEVVANL
jgi:CBS domain-containing protein